MAVTNLAYRQIATIRNPFSDSINDPKIPDGKCSQSLGFRNQAVADFTIGTDTVNILLFPGIGAGVYCDSAKFGDDDPEPYVINFTAEHIKLGYLGSATEKSLEQESATFAARWRVVSQAMKVTLVNGTDDNEGWWEAIRFVPPITPEEFTAKSADGCIPNEEGDLWGRVTAGVNGQSTAGAQIINTPGYTTGKLRDLHKHMFYLQHHQNSHDFTPLEREYKWDPTKPDSHEYEDMVKSLWDHNMDVVLLRVHGSSLVIPNSCCKPTKLMFHVVQNQEVIYNNNGILSQLMTRSESAPDAVEKAFTALSRSPAASMPGKTLSKTYSVLKTRARVYKRTGTIKYRKKRRYRKKT